jgi:glycerol-3-phosphate acyltransferase PlsX
MPDKKIIAVDAMGGDFGPAVTVPAAAMAQPQCSSINFLFFGDEARIAPLLNQNPALKAVSSVVHTDKMIAADDKPSIALRTGKGSSMRLAIEAVRDGAAHGVVSGGNTGALMAMAKMILKCLPGITRPAIASVFPTKTEDTVLLDLGANIGCDAEMLVQFAVLGAVYARAIRSVANPTVGILNVGSEDMKGNDHVRGAASILSQVEFPGKFIGFVEGNDIPGGGADVIVTDGFTGNVALKVAEGVAELTSYYMKQAFSASLLAKLGALLAWGSLQKVKKRIDHRAYNGGMFLGLNGICVKSHGNMDVFGFSRAILVAAGLVEKGYNDRVALEIEQLMGQESFISGLAAATAEAT